MRAMLRSSWLRTRRVVPSGPGKAAIASCPSGVRCPSLMGVPARPKWTKSKPSGRSSVSVSFVALSVRVIGRRSPYPPSPFSAWVGRAPAARTWRVTRPWNGPPASMAPPAAAAPTTALRRRNSRRLTNGRSGCLCPMPRSPSRGMDVRGVTSARRLLKGLMNHARYRLRFQEVIYCDAQNPLTSKLVEAEGLVVDTVGIVLQQRERILARAVLSQA